MNAHLAAVRAASEPSDVAWLALGAHPFHPTDALPRMPKERYRIMREYLPSRGPLALDMMHATASVQASFDYADEADMIAKLRTARAVQPYVSAIFANSSLCEGRPSGFISRRMHVWRLTDPARCGGLPFAFEEGFGYARYAEWALDVPMFFASVHISGAGNAVVWVLDTLDVEISGAGNVKYFGSPEVTQDISGAGKVASQGDK